MEPVRILMWVVAMAVCLIAISLAQIVISGIRQLWRYERGMRAWFATLRETTREDQ